MQAWALQVIFAIRLVLGKPRVALTALNPTANIEILAAGPLVLDGLARQF